MIPPTHPQSAPFGEIRVTEDSARGLSKKPRIRMIVLRRWILDSARSRYLRKTALSVTSGTPVNAFDSGQFSFAPAASF